MIVSNPQVYFARRRGMGDIPYAPVKYCNIPGVGLTACPGQDLQAIQNYNFQVQTDTNNSLNQKNCNDAWVLNGRVGPNNCASMYPVSGATSVPQPTAPTRTTTVAYVGNQYVDSTPNRTQASVTQDGGATQTSATQTSTNAGNMNETSGASSTGIGISGLEIIIGVVSVGLAFLAMNRSN